MSELVLSTPPWFAAVSAAALVLGVLLTWPRRGPGLSVPLLSLAGAGLLWLLLNQPLVSKRQEESLTLRTPPLAAEGAGRYLGGDEVGEAPDLAWLARRQEGLGQVAVRGWGLPLAAWDDWMPLELAFEAEPLPDGIVELHWNRRLLLGRSLRIEGRAKGLVTPAWRVVLKGPGEVVLDESAPGEDGWFRLTAVPRLSGQRIYRLELHDAAGQLREAGPVPVQVHEPQAPRVAMELARPSFEASALVEWLRRSGAQVQVEIRLSRGIEGQQRIGDAPAPEPGLPELERLDLLVLDGASLLRLREASGELLWQAVARGLGVLVLADGELLEAPVEAVPGLRFRDRGEASEVTLAGPNAWTVRRLGLAVTAAPGASPEALVSAANGEPLILALEQGRLVISLLEDSYRWRTALGPGAYAGFWSRILDGAIRPMAPGIEARTASPWPKARERVTVCPERLDRCRRVWPEAPGWFSPAEGTAPVYIYAEEDWNGLRATADRRATQLAATRSGADEETARRLEPWLAPDLLLLTLGLVLGALWVLWKLGAASAASEREEAS